MLFNAKKYGLEMIHFEMLNTEINVLKDKDTSWNIFSQISILSQCVV